MMLTDTGIPVALLLYLLTSLSEVMTSDIYCPETFPCNCTAESIWLNGRLYQHRVIDCSHRHLDEVPDFSQLRNRFYHRLLLQDNNIRQINSHAFSGLAVRYLNLTNNPLTFEGVKEDSFSGLTKLVNLSMSHCELISTPRAMAVLTKLRTLDLSHNRITILLEGVMKQLRHLVHLDVSHNKVEFTWPYYAFSNMKRLKYLNVAHNELENIPTALEQTPALTHFDASWNRIDGFLPEYFKHAPNLVHVDLRRNPISFEGKSELFKFLPNLQYLHLSHCNIPRLYPGVFQKPTNISSFTVAWCNVSHIDSNFFTLFPALKHLNIQGNPLPLQIKYFVGIEDSLETLHVDNMHVSNFSLNHLKYFSQLKSVYATRNNIGSFKPYSMYGVMKRNMWLHLDYSKVTTFHHTAFDLLDFPAVLSLKGVNLKRLDFIVRDPCRFSGISINVEENPIDCDCPLRELEAKKIVNLTGTCATPLREKGKLLSWKPDFKNRDSYFSGRLSNSCVINVNETLRYDCTCGVWKFYNDTSFCPVSVYSISSASLLPNVNLFALLFVFIFTLSSFKC